MDVLGGWFGAVFGVHFDVGCQSIRMKNHLKRGKSLHWDVRARNVSCNSRSFLGVCVAMRCIFRPGLCHRSGDVANKGHVPLVLNAQLLHCGQRASVAANWPSRVVQRQLQTIALHPPVALGTTSVHGPWRAPAKNLSQTVLSIQSSHQAHAKNHAYQPHATLKWCSDASGVLVSKLNRHKRNKDRTQVFTTSTE